MLRGEVIPQEIAAPPVPPPGEIKREYDSAVKEFTAQTSFSRGEAVSDGAGNPAADPANKRTGAEGGTGSLGSGSTAASVGDPVMFFRTKSDDLRSALNSAAQANGSQNITKLRETDGDILIELGNIAKKHGR